MLKNKFYFDFFKEKKLKNFILNYIRIVLKRHYIFSLNTKIFVDINI